VLAYRAHEVPVGDDQRQHVELMRDVAQRFNERFGDQLVVPKLRIPAVGARIMDLQDPTSKMSTTGGTPEGTVYVLDDPKAVEKKFKRAVTDSDDPPQIVRDKGKPGVSNLIDILAAAKGITPEQVEADMADARGYGDLKIATADAVNALLEPVRERYAELRPDEDALEAIFAAGAEKARAITRETLRDVRRVTGIGPRA
jgi:tryptophanyl-tRNA synthetase